MVGFRVKCSVFWRYFSPLNLISKLKYKEQSHCHIRMLWGFCKIRDEKNSLVCAQYFVNDTSLHSYLISSVVMSQHLLHIFSVLNISIGILFVWTHIILIARRSQEASSCTFHIWGSEHTVNSRYMPMAEEILRESWELNKVPGHVYAFDWHTLFFSQIKASMYVLKRDYVQLISVVIFITNECGLQNC